MASESVVLPAAVNRRDFLRGAAGSAGIAVTAPWALRGSRPATRAAAAPAVRIGCLGPFSGVLAPYYGPAAAYVSGSLHSYFRKHGIVIAGRRHDVDVTAEDTQGSLVTAQEEASLMIRDGVDLILVQDAPDIVTIVAQACRRSGVPCISTGVPWEVWFESLGGKLRGTRAESTSWKWAYHFFWAFADLEAVYADLWGSLATDNKVAGLWPEDVFGDALASGKTAVPAVLGKLGYQFTPARYQDGDPDIGSFVTTFQDANAQILTGIPGILDFSTFWTVAQANSYQPTIATISGQAAFPAAVDYVGATAAGISCEVWWSPTFPYRSSITGQSAAELARAYTSAMKLQWSQAVGSTHAMFEVARAALIKAGSPSRADVNDALSGLTVKTIAGPLSWRTGPVKNVAATPLLGGQWQQGTTYPLELVIVANKQDPKIPLGGSLEPMSYG